MPIRSSTKVGVALASALAAAATCLPPPAHAAEGEEGPAPQADTRDLRPTPSKRPDGAGQRPQVTLRPSSPVVPVGAPVSFEVGSSVNGFGHLYVISASGRVQVWMENVPIAAGQRLFPAGGNGIEAAAPAGREELMLIV